MLFPEEVWQTVRSYLPLEEEIFNCSEQRWNIIIENIEWDRQKVVRLFNLNVKGKIRGQNRLIELCRQDGGFMYYLPPEPGPIFYRDEFSVDALDNWYNAYPSSLDETWNQRFVIFDILVSEENKIRRWLEMVREKGPIFEKNLSPKELSHSLYHTICQIQRPLEIKILFDLTDYRLQYIYYDLLRTYLRGSNFEPVRNMCEAGIFKKSHLFRLYNQFRNTPGCRPQCRELAVHLDPGIWIADNLDETEDIPWDSDIL